MRIQSFIQPDENSCVGYLLSVEDFVPHNDGDDTIINMICQSLSGTSCCSKIAIIALRILFTIGVIVAAAIDLVIWTLKTITVIPAIRRGCPEHLADFTSALFCSVTAIAIIFGYPPTVREDIEINWDWEHSRNFVRNVSPHKLILGGNFIYSRKNLIYLLSSDIEQDKKREQHFKYLIHHLELGVCAEANSLFEFETFHKNMQAFIDKTVEFQKEFLRFDQEQNGLERTNLQNTETEKFLKELEEIAMTCRYSSEILNCFKPAFLFSANNWEKPQPFLIPLSILKESEKYAQFLVDKKQELVDARQKFRDKTVSFLPVNEGSKNLILGFL